MYLLAEYTGIVSVCGERRVIGTSFEESRERGECELFSRACGGHAECSVWSAMTWTPLQSVMLHFSLLQLIHLLTMVFVCRLSLTNHSTINNAVCKTSKCHQRSTSTCWKTNSAGAECYTIILALSAPQFEWISIDRQLVFAVWYYYYRCRHVWSDFGISSAQAVWRWVEAFDNLNRDQTSLLQSHWLQWGTLSFHISYLTSCCVPSLTTSVGPYQVHIELDPEDQEQSWHQSGWRAGSVCHQSHLCPQKRGWGREFGLQIWIKMKLQHISWWEWSARGRVQLLRQSQKLWALDKGGRLHSHKLSWASMTIFTHEEHLHHGIELTYQSGRLHLLREPGLFWVCLLAHYGFINLSLSCLHASLIASTFKPICLWRRFFLMRSLDFILFTQHEDFSKPKEWYSPATATQVESVWRSKTKLFQCE